MDDQYFIKEAVRLARQGMIANAGGPFGAVIVRKGQIIGRGYNRVTSMNDPTAHAEIVAIRDACRFLGTFKLDESTMYVTSEPCPMCLGAIYWARISRVVYLSGRDMAAAAGFDDSFIFEEFALPVGDRRLITERAESDEVAPLFQEWAEKKDKIQY